jgi:hypothetical protein
MQTYKNSSMMCIFLYLFICYVTNIIPLTKYAQIKENPNNPQRFHNPKILHNYIYLYHYYIYFYFYIKFGLYSWVFQVRSDFRLKI